MPFQKPNAFSKDLAESTDKVYTTYLNKIAAAGYDTPQSLVDSADAVAAFIAGAEPGDDNQSRHKRRYYISAVFWVLPERYRKTPNPYSRLNEASLPKAVLIAGQVKDFVAKRML